LRIKKEAIIGAIVIATLVVFIWGFNYLKGNNIFHKELNYYVVYNKIGGLITSSPVLVNGYKVGQVREISLHPDNSGRLVVNFILETEVKIPVKSIARIYSADLMGTKAIEIIFSDSANYCNIGDTLVPEIERDLKEEVNAQVLPLKTKAEDLMSSFDSLLTAVQSVFTDSVRENLRRSFTSIRYTLQNINATSKTVDDLVTSQSGRIAEIFAHIHEITGSISANSAKLSNIINNFSALSDSIAKANIVTTINNINKILLSVNEITGKINRGEGSAGLLINDDKLYRNLQNSSAELGKLLKDIRENPRRYLNFSFISFGKEKKNKDTGYNPSLNNLEKGSFYTVQLLSGSRLLEDNSKIFNDIDSIFIFQKNGYFRYLTGYSENLDSIRLLRDHVKKFFPEAFIVAFRNGERIPFN
jgi:phospholipid/cholesterol/gamma-HCH transport system substrate-binding protein